MVIYHLSNHTLYTWTCMDFSSKSILIAMIATMATNKLNSNNCAGHCSARQMKAKIANWDCGCVCVLKQHWNQKMAAIFVGLCELWWVTFLVRQYQALTHTSTLHSMASFIIMFFCIACTRWKVLLTFCMKVKIQPSVSLLSSTLSHRMDIMTFGSGYFAKQIQRFL